MMVATCHCGAVRVEVPSRPEQVTRCNCSICRRTGAIWAYYPDADVTLIAAPVAGPADATEGYIWGDKNLSFIRCKTCGCIMQWKGLDIKEDSWAGVNARNFDPAELGAVPVRLLDGADTWAERLLPPRTLDEI